MIYFDSDMSKYKYGSILWLEDGNLLFMLAENVAHNLCNSNNTAPSIGIIRVTIYAVKGKVSDIHRRMC
jgi:hypothetical protein